jgi:hypothetical protein
LSKVLKKNNGYKKRINAGGIYKIGFVKAPQKVNDVSGRMMHRGSAVHGRMQEP